jgi:hypothetical protein
MSLSYKYIERLGSGCKKYRRYFKMSQNETNIVMALVKMLPFVYTAAKYFI